MIVTHFVTGANLFISCEGVLKIGDFGLARKQATFDICDKSPEGTYLYSAPEVGLESPLFFLRLFEVWKYLLYQDFCFVLNMMQQYQPELNKTVDFRVIIKIMMVIIVLCFFHACIARMHGFHKRDFCTWLVSHVWISSSVLWLDAILDTNPIPASWMQCLKPQKRTSGPKWSEEYKIDIFCFI